MPYIQKENLSYKEANEGIKTPFVLQLKRGSSTKEGIKNISLEPGEIFFEKDTGFLYINNQQISKTIENLIPVNLGLNPDKNTIDNLAKLTDIKDMVKTEDIKDMVKTSDIEDVVRTEDILSLTAKKTSWGAQIKTTKWSRLCYLGNSDYTGMKFILNIRGTRSDVVYHDTFAICSHHAKKASIVKISGSKYLNPSYQLRVLVDNIGNCYIDMLEDVKNVSTEITYTAYCTLIDIDKSGVGVTTYTSYTDGETIPDGFSKAAEMRITSASLQGDMPTLELAGGGTGATTAMGAQYNLLKDMSKSTNAISDTEQIVVKYSSPNSTNGVLLYKEASLLSTYINNKLPTATSGIKGILSVGSNLTISNGVISLSKQNITNALGYTPPNMTFNSGTGYLQFGNYKICWGQVSTGNYSTSGDGYADVAVTSGRTYASAFTSNPTVFFQSNSYAGVIDVQLAEGNQNGITKIRIHRRTSSGEVAGVIINYLAIGI